MRNGVLAWLLAGLAVACPPPRAAPTELAPTTERAAPSIERPPIGALAPLALPAVERHSMAHGVTAWLAPHEADLFQACLVLRHASAALDWKQRFAGWLLADVLPAATPLELTTTAGPVFAACHTGLPGEGPRAVEALATLLAAPSFDRPAVNTARRRTIAQLRAARRGPGSASEVETLRGWPDTALTELSALDLATLWRRVTTPDDVVIIVAGRFARTPILQALDAPLASWKPPAPFTRVPHPPPPRSTVDLVLYETTEERNRTVIRHWLLPAPDDPAGQVASSVLVDMLNDERLQAASSTIAWEAASWPGVDGRLAFATLQLDHDTAPTSARGRMDEVLDRVRNGSFDPHVLEGAKTRYREHLRRRLSMTPGRMSLLQNIWLREGSPEDLAALDTAAGELTVPAIAAHARAHLPSAGPVLVSVTPEEARELLRAREVRAASRLVWLPPNREPFRVSGLERLPLLGGAWWRVRSSPTGPVGELIYPNTTIAVVVRDWQAHVVPEMGAPPRQRPTKGGGRQLTMADGSTAELVQDDADVRVTIPLLHLGQTADAP